ncbi:MAG: lamin tail domain-containing protein [Verrucomicrobia bacterium]|nr:lamin tail domain-containing protein [Verrucomicrobiota bacterium]
MASNGSTIADGDGDFEDWIELYNFGNSVVSLAGWGLSDSNSNPFKWVFSTGTSIAPGQYLIIWASGKDRSTHTNFSISAQGEPLTLSTPEGEVVDFVPAIAVPRDVSYGRVQADPSSWAFFLPTDAWHGQCHPIQR